MSRYLPIEAPHPLPSLLYHSRTGKGAEQMDFDATQAWCTDLGVELDDVVVLAVAELTQAPTMGYFDRKPWIEGWRKVKKDSLEAQKAYVDTMRKDIQSSEEYFKKVYMFCFDYAKETGQKSLGGSRGEAGKRDA